VLVLLKPSPLELLNLSRLTLSLALKCFSPPLTVLVLSRFIPMLPVNLVPLLVKLALL
jgi:hypothetical protein